MTELTAQEFWAMQNAQHGANIYNQKLVVVLRSIRARHPSWVKVCKPRLDTENMPSLAICYALLTATGQEVLAAHRQRMATTAIMQCVRCGAKESAYFASHEIYTVAIPNYLCIAHR